MSTKMSPCCARLNSRIIVARDDLRRLARKAAVAAERGHSIEKFKTMIESAKTQVEDAERSLVDHEAEHAGQAEVA